jgi:hypothetical protein
MKAEQFQENRMSTLMGVIIVVFVIGAFRRLSAPSGETCMSASGLADDQEFRWKGGKWRTEGPCDKRNEQGDVVRNIRHVETKKLAQIRWDEKVKWSPPKVVRK